MAKLEFCPKDCLRDPELDPINCEGCWILESVSVKPPMEGTSKLKPYQPVRIVGINRNLYHIEETMSNGQISRGTLDRDSVKLKK